jgi:NAD-dependent SIR2 family protein deacetylase
MSDPTLDRAADLVWAADALLITAGAGMGVDSGLPDFRGDQGFWKAYPPFEKLGLRFTDMARPEWFERDPQLAWGFYGHRLNLYRATPPHAGFGILRKWIEARDLAAFVYTSNVDGAFQRAGFPANGVCEVHGTIHYFQCTDPCRNDLWPAPEGRIDLDETTMRAQGDLPKCPACGSLARPNILLFNDGTWVLDRSHAQEQNLQAWLSEVFGARLVVLEFGAGLAVPTVRMLSEQVGRSRNATLIRVNPREPQVPAGQLGYPLGSLAFLRGVDELLASRSGSA